MKITVIGGGNMGLVYAKSIHENFKNSTISIIEIDSTKIKNLKENTPFNIHTNPADCIPSADVILLAIKPQNSQLIFKKIKTLITKNQIIISIMAGVTIQTISQGLNTLKVVRAMPNLPAQIGHGVTGFITSLEISNSEEIQVQEILAATGTAVKVTRESSIDAITALSGSGPAYVFYFMNAMMEKAQTLGFSESDAKNIVLNTFSGTDQLFESSNINSQTWIDKVTSKGGTTHAAITNFKHNNLSEKIQEGVQAAFDRAQELGKM